MRHCETCGFLGISGYEYPESYCKCGIQDDDPKLSEDAISRADAVRVASGYCHPANIAKELAKLPPVTPIRPKGHWIRELIRNEKGGCIGAKMICSKCGNDNKHDEYMNYCPNCGAKMVESQESEALE